VIINKVGSAPLAQCSVSAVRPCQTYSRTDSGVPGAGGDDLVTTVTEPDRLRRRSLLTG
jgi:hypothetical protein